MPVWFTALETHGPFPGPPPDHNADAYLAEEKGEGASTYGGGGAGNSPRSVYGGSNVGRSRPGWGNAGGGSGYLSVVGGGVATPGDQPRRGDANVSTKSGLGINRTGGGGAG